jgi:hypothetical protein
MKYCPAKTEFPETSEGRLPNAGVLEENTFVL